MSKRKIGSVFVDGMLGDHEISLWSDGEWRGDHLLTEVFNLAHDPRVNYRENHGERGVKEVEDAARSRGLKYKIYGDHKRLSILRMDAEFEAKHPRDKIGRFTHKGKGVGKKSPYYGEGNSIQEFVPSYMSVTTDSFTMFKVDEDGEGDEDFKVRLKMTNPYILGQDQSDWAYSEFIDRVVAYHTVGGLPPEDDFTADMVSEYIESLFYVDPDARKTVNYDGLIIDDPTYGKLYLVPNPEQVEVVSGDSDAIDAWKMEVKYASANRGSRDLHKHLLNTAQGYGDRSSSLQGISLTARSEFKREVVERIYEDLQWSESFQEAAKTIIDQIDRDSNIDPAEWGNPEVARAIDLLVSQWAATSADHNSMSIALQNAVSEVFSNDPSLKKLGLHVPRFRFRGRNTREDDLESNAMQLSKKIEKENNGETFKALQQFVKSQYNATQSLLKELGVESLSVYRGMTFSERPDWVEAAEMGPDFWSKAFNAYGAIADKLIEDVDKERNALNDRVLSQLEERPMLHEQVSVAYGELRATRGKFYADLYMALFGEAKGNALAQSGFFQGKDVDQGKITLALSKISDTLLEAVDSYGLGAAGHDDWVWLQKMQEPDRVGRILGHEITEASKQHLVPDLKSGKGAKRSVAALASISLNSEDGKRRRLAEAARHYVSTEVSYDWAKVMSAESKDFSSAFGRDRDKIGHRIISSGLIDEDTVGKVHDLEVLQGAFRYGWSLPSDLQMDAEALKPKYKAKRVRFLSQPASSWSLYQSTAMEFANRSIGWSTLASSQIPRERILATPLTGVGCLSEAEVVAIGSDEPDKGMEITAPVKELKYAHVNEIRENDEWRATMWEG